jgi:hypothetical protein
MSGINDREKAEEARFAHNEELEFKANARRNKLLGLWAADLMGLSGQAADDYARSVIVADFEEAGDDDVFRKIRADLDAKSITQSDHQIRRQMDDLLGVAREQVRTEIR